jgi:hypothetical protein
MRSEGWLSRPTPGRYREQRRVGRVLPTHDVTVSRPALYDGGER